MSFRETLSRIVHLASGGVGAVLVDDEGETIDLFTSGDGYQTRLAGAHQSIVLKLMDEAAARTGNGDGIRGFFVKSDRLVHSIMPVSEGVFIVLIQDATGLPSQGMKVLEDALPGLADLI